MRTDRSGRTPAYGQPVQLGPGLVRILAPNPSAMTHWGTNSYILGERAVCVIDPGPDHPAHLAALLAQIGTRQVSHIVLTHGHLDHSALSRPLARLTGAPVLGFGDHLAGRSAAMSALWRTSAQAALHGGEGVDTGFFPDTALPDGVQIIGQDWQLQVVHTPGHMRNHICLRWADAVFSGDHVMGWASSIVSPPDGDLTDYLRSCARLRALAPRILYPGHGDPVPDPVARIDALLAHRATREGQILTELSAGPATIKTLTARIYTDTPPALHAAAGRNVFAHLIDLTGRNLVTADPALDAGAVFSLCRSPVGD